MKIALSKEELPHSRPPYVSPSPFLSPPLLHLFSLQSVESGIYSHTPRVASLNAAGEELINASSTENTAEVQEDLKGLNDKCVLF